LENRTWENGTWVPIRQLLARSGCYRVVAIGDHADAAKTRSLHDCGGCAAAIALKLGADQSLVGVIRRVSRTKYTFRFQLRDARPGDLISVATAGFEWAPIIHGAKARRPISDRFSSNRSRA
jgi:hypothetical protein